jgi:UDP-N-acetylglucosamine 2-epimerase (non-hydrolysing)
MKKYKNFILQFRPPEIILKKGLFRKIKEQRGIIHLVLIATKPDIIKQAPLILELKKKGEYVLVVHSGQHYDWNLSGGLEREFGIIPDVNLNVKGKLYEQQAQIIYRLGYLLARIKKMGKLVIPYTYGDTTTAVAGGIASFTNLIGVSHVEAGLRTMTPPKELFTRLLKDFDVSSYCNRLRDARGWSKGSYEPFPEQFDTRAAAPSAGVHFAPTPLNAKHLMDEGFDRERIFVVGNPVSDALTFAKKRIKKSRIFKQYPVLEKGGVIRFCIHRRENVSSKHRFKSIIEAMISFIEEERTVLLISLGATEKALKIFGLKRRIEDLAKKYKNFVYSPVWPHYADVVAVMEKCSVIATDSGSIQEETNCLRVPGVILRFNSDRPEAIFAGTNILAPPIKSEIIAKIIREVADNKELNSRMRRAKKLYGKEVSKKIVSVVKKITKRESLFELFEQERLGLTKFKFWEKGRTNW